MSDLISMDKQYKTRDGRAVEVLKVDMKHKYYPVAVVITEEDGSQAIRSRTSTGDTTHSRTTGGDLVEVKPRIKQNVWVNIHDGDNVYVHKTREGADLAGGETRIACINMALDYEYGEGL